MFHVALDTDILRQDPQRKGPAFGRLHQLIADGHVQLHMPVVTCREFITAITYEYRKSLNEGRAALKSVRGDFLDGIRPELTGELRALRERVGSLVEEDFERWLKKCGAEKYSVPLTAMPVLVDAYFSGSAPFKAVKNRTDFPDALIWSTLLEISTKVGELHFVARDKGWKPTVSETPHIKLHSSIEGFLTDTFDELASQTDDRLLTLLVANLPDLERRAADLAEFSLQGQTVQSDDLPEDNNEALISMAYQPSALRIDTQNVENLGGGNFIFAFDGQADVTLDYAIYKGDFALLDDDRALQMGISDLNRHYFEVEESATVQFTGNLAVQIAYDLSKPEIYLSNAKLSELVLNASYDVEDVEVTELIIHRSDS